MTITVKELKQLTEGRPDDEQISLNVEYDEVCNESVFVRLESLTVEAGQLNLMLSLTDGTDEGEETD